MYKTKSGSPANVALRFTFKTYIMTVETSGPFGIHLIPSDRNTMGESEGTLNSDTNGGQ
jgi:hypothetical protein